MAQNKVDLTTFYSNLAQSLEIFNSIWQDYTGKMPLLPRSEFDPFNISQTFLESFQKLSSEPEVMLNSSFDLYKNLSELWLETAKDFLLKIQR